MQRSLALFALLSLFAFAAPGRSQEAARPAQAAAPTVTATATSAGVRFAAIGAVSRTRLEVYDAAGSPVFDSGFLPGNVRDWGASAAGLADGTYACVLTSRELSGRLSIKQAAVLLRGGEVSLARGEAAAAGEAGVGQTTSAATEGGGGAATLSTHDGRDGALTSTSGDLTLRTGDVLSGKERERLRVTEDGRVGVGTVSPNARLQVAGGDAAVTTQGKGLILRATDGPNCFRITVNNAGALSAAAVPCP